MFNLLKGLKGPVEVEDKIKALESVEQEDNKGYDSFESYANISEDFLGITGHSLTLGEFYRKYKHHIKNCIDLIGEDVQDMDWGFFSGQERLEKTDYTPFFNRPNQRMDWQDFIFDTVGCLETGGDAYWWYPKKFRRVGIKKMFFLTPQHTQFDYDNSGNWNGYKFMKAGSYMHFDIDEIIHFKYPNPGDPHGYGKGTVQSLESQVIRFDSIEDFENAILNNMGVISALVTGGNDTNNRRLVVELRRTSAGSKNAGKIIGVPKDYDVKDGPGFSPQDIGLSEIKKKITEELYMCFKVPMLLAGVTEKVNRSNMYEAKIVFKTFKTFKVAKRLQRTINSYLLSDEPFDFRFIYKLPPDPELEADNNVKYIQNAIRSRKEVRLENGWDAYPDSDRVFMPISYTEGQSTDSKKAAKAAQVEGSKEVLKFPVPNIKVYDPLVFGEKSNKIFMTWQGKLEKEMRERGLYPVWKWLGKKIAQELRSYKSSKSEDPDIVAGEILIAPEIIASEFAAHNNGFIKEAVERMIIQRATELQVDLPNDMLQRYLQQHYLRLEDTWEGIAGTDVKQLSEIIRRGINEDRTLANIAKEIEARYQPTSADFMNEWRAGTIARSETSIAANKASHDYMKHAGIQTTTWIVSGSGRERMTHLAAHGQTVGIDEPYLVGGFQLMHPCDPSGPPEEVINCQCSDVPTHSFTM